MNGDGPKSIRSATSISSFDMQGTTTGSGLLVLSLLVVLVEYLVPRSIVHGTPY